MQSIYVIIIFYQVSECLHTLMLLGIRLNELKMMVLVNFSAKLISKLLIINSIVVVNQKERFQLFVLSEC